MVRSPGGKKGAGPKGTKMKRCGQAALRGSLVVLDAAGRVVARVIRPEGAGPPFSAPRGWGGHCPSYCPDKGQPRARHLDPHPADSLPHSPQLAGADLAELERSPERSVAREVTAAISNGSAVLPGGQQCQCRGEEEAGCCTRWVTKLWRSSESQADLRFWGHMLSSTPAANPGCGGGQCT